VSQPWVTNEADVGRGEWSDPVRVLEGEGTEAIEAIEGMEHTHGGDWRTLDGVRPCMSTRGEEHPIELDGVPAEEGISPADVAERLDEDPEEQVNRTDQD
jgi:hypothetical protein